MVRHGIVKEVMSVRHGVWVDSISMVRQGCLVDRVEVV